MLDEHLPRASVTAAGAAIDRGPARDVRMRLAAEKRGVAYPGAPRRLYVVVRPHPPLNPT